MSKCVSCLNHVMCQIPDPDDCSMYLDKSKYFKMPPCKIGDFVWAIRNYNGIPHAQQGKVIDMFFCKDMKLHIVVSHISRGEWGEKVFATYEDAMAKINEMNKKG